MDLRVKVASEPGTRLQTSGIIQLDFTNTHELDQHKLEIQSTKLGRLTSNDPEMGIGIAWRCVSTKMVSYDYRLFDEFQITYYIPSGKQT